MGHHHDEDHGAVPHQLTFKEKGGKLIEHWIHHNQEHIGNYRRWESEFRTQQHPSVADLLSSAAELTGRINELLSEAARLLAAQKK